MRMWCVNPKLMCDKHLLGEHLEVHMFFNIILERKMTLHGYVSSGLLDSTKLVGRHKELVEEMESRGFNHQSPLATGGDVDIAMKFWPGKVDAVGNYEILRKRCARCFKLQEEAFFDATGLPLEVKHA
jgi:hypothetical protein